MEFQITKDGKDQNYWENKIKWEACSTRQWTDPHEQTRADAGGAAGGAAERGAACLINGGNTLAIH